MSRAQALAIVSLALAAGSSACGGPREGAAPCAPAPTLRVAVALPPGSGSVPRESVSSEVYSDASLIQLDRGGRPQPALVQSWQTPDRRTWTLTLREGLRRQNGAAVTAPGVRDLVNGIWSKAAYAALRQDLQGIDAPTPTTLVFRFARPNALLPDALGASRLAADAGRPDWFAGPFRPVRDTPDEMTFEPFPGTWSGPPAVASLRLRFFPTPREAWAAFLRNEVDVFHEVPPEALPLLAERRDVQLFDLGSRFTFTLGFQLRHPLLRDVRVRQALNLAIDRDALVRRFFGAYSTPAHGPFAPGYWAAGDAGEGAGAPWPYDPVAARALLKAATAGRAQPIELECLTVDRFPIHAEFAAALAAQLEQVRVRLRIVVLPLDEMLRRMGTGEFELFASPLRTGPGGLAPYSFWRSPQWTIRTNYTAADAPFDALRSAVSDDETRAAARAVLDVMRRDPPAVFVVATPSMRAVRRTWRVPDGEPDIRRTMPYWTLAEAPPCVSR